MNLHRIAYGQQRTFEPWHYKLAGFIPANAVANIFAQAQVREDDGALVFKTSALAALAEEYRPGVEAAFGAGIKIEAEALTPVAPPCGRPRVFVPVK